MKAGIVAISLLSLSTVASQPLSDENGEDHAVWGISTRQDNGGSPSSDSHDLAPWLVLLQSVRETALHQAEEEISQMQEKQESLNRHLRSGQFSDTDLATYAEQSTEFTDNVVKAVNQTIAPYTGVLSKAVANFLVQSYYNSVTTGATLYNTYLGQHPKAITAQLTGPMHNLVRAYNGLIGVSKIAALSNADTLMTVNNDILALLGIHR